MRHQEVLLVNDLFLLSKAQMRRIYRYRTVFRGLVTG